MLAEVSGVECLLHVYLCIDCYGSRTTGPLDSLISEIRGMLRQLSMTGSSCHRPMKSLS